MTKIIVSLIFGFLAFLSSFTGLGLIFAIPGLILGIFSLKTTEKKITIPIGYKGRYGNKKISAQPFVSIKYISYIAIGINILSLVVSLTAIIPLFIAALYII